MKKTLKVFGLIALAAMIGLSFVSCSDGGGGGGGGGGGSGGSGSGGNRSGSTSTVYESKDAAGNFYILEVISSKSKSRAAAPVAYTPKTGDFFTLTIITPTGDTWTDSGTVTITAAAITLSGMNSLTVTVSGNDMVKIEVPAGTTITVGSATITTVTVTPTATQKSFEVPNPFILAANRWEDGDTSGEGWAGGFDYRAVTSVPLKANNRYTFLIRGTTNKTLEKVSLTFETHPEDWSDYQWIGGSEQVRLSGTFEQVFDINVGDEVPKDGYIVQLTLTNNVALPAKYENYVTVMATISNFECRLVGINLPDMKVSYHDSIKNQADAKKRTDFSFLVEWDVTTGKWVSVPLSRYMDGSPSVTVTNGKVSMNLGTPKSEYLGNTFDGWDGVTTIPANPKLFLIWDFSSSDSKYKINPWRHNYYNSSGTCFVYAGEDTTVNGCLLKKGWNWLYVTDNGSYTFTASNTQHKDVQWFCDEITE